MLCRRFRLVTVILLLAAADPPDKFYGSQLNGAMKRPQSRIEFIPHR